MVLSPGCARGALGLLLLLSLPAVTADMCAGRTDWRAFAPSEVPACIADSTIALENGPNHAEFYAVARCVVSEPERRAAMMAEIATSNACVAETLMQFEGQLAASDDTESIIRRAYTHYVINTPGPLGDGDQFDPVEYSLAYARRMLQVEPGQATLEAWRGSQSFCDSACQLRAIGQSINMARYGRSDVIPSTLFPFRANAEEHDSHNALWLADMAELVYHKWRCPSADPNVAPQPNDDPKSWTCVRDQLAAWGYQGHWIAVQDTEVFVATREDHAVIAFRGTATLLDVATDLKAWLKTFPGGGKVHSGFAAALEAVWPELAKAVKALPDTHPIFITGHSLGGALAQLAAYRIELELGRSVHAVYAYGAPRVGNRQFAKRYGKRLSKRTFLHINGRDPVARVPTRPFYLQNSAYVGRFDNNNHHYDSKPLAEEQDPPGLLNAARVAIAKATSYLTQRPENEIPLSYGSVNSFDTSIGGVSSRQPVPFQVCVYEHRTPLRKDRNTCPDSSHAMMRRQIAPAS